MPDPIKKIQAVIFDLDGTLADTLPVSYAAFRATLLKYTSRDYSDKEIHSLFGPSEDGILEKIIGEGWGAAFEYYSDQYEKAHYLCPAPFPGIMDILRDLNKRGICIAVVTGKGARSAASSMKWLKLDTQIKIVEAGSPTGSVKPEAIRKVLGLCGIDPEFAAYVGDSPNDITESRKAGTLPIAVAWTPQVDVEKLRAKEPSELFMTTKELAEWIDKYTEA